jgi:hypothetical protein
LSAFGRFIEPFATQADVAFCFIPPPLNVHTTMPNDTFRLRSCLKF